MGDFGSTEGGGYNEISLAYKREPTLENYVSLRRGDPDAEIEVAVIGGIDQLFALESELRRFGFDPQMIASVLDANPDAIGEISLQIMEKIIEARRLQRAGETHLVSRGLAVPDKMIDWIIACALDGLSWNDQLEIPRDLIVLIRERLGGSRPEYEQIAQVHQHKLHAAMVGGQLKAQGVTPTFRLLGKIFGVAPSTVKRWFDRGEFDVECDCWSSCFDSNGKLRPLFERRGDALQTKEAAQR